MSYSCTYKLTADLRYYFLFSYLIWRLSSVLQFTAWWIKHIGDTKGSCLGKRTLWVQKQTVFYFEFFFYFQFGIAEKLEIATCDSCNYFVFLHLIGHGQKVYALEKAPKLCAFLASFTFIRRPLFDRKNGLSCFFVAYYRTVYLCICTV